MPKDMQNEIRKAVGLPIVEKSRARGQTDQVLIETPTETEAERMAIFVAEEIPDWARGFMIVRAKELDTTPSELLEKFKKAAQDEDDRTQRTHNEMETQRRENIERNRERAPKVLERMLREDYSKFYNDGKRVEMNRDHCSMPNCNAKTNCEYVAKVLCRNIEIDIPEAELEEYFRRSILHSATGYYGIPCSKCGNSGGWFRFTPTRGE